MLSGGSIVCLSLCAILLNMCQILILCHCCLLCSFTSCYMILYHFRLFWLYFLRLFHLLCTVVKESVWFIAFWYGYVSYFGHDFCEIAGSQLNFGCACDGHGLYWYWWVSCILSSLQGRIYNYPKVSCDDCNNHYGLMIGNQIMIRVDYAFCIRLCGNMHIFYFRVTQYCCTGLSLVGMPGFVYNHCWRWL